MCTAAVCVMLQLLPRESSEGERRRKGRKIRRRGKKGQSEKIRIDRVSRELKRGRESGRKSEENKKGEGKENKGIN